jgi:TRAP-type C4-dicarboxylate transport system substrate-binding protein
LSREVSSKAVAELKAKGMLFKEISASEQARMRNAVKPVHEKHAVSYDPPVV